MATYNIQELHDLLTTLIADGYKYVDIELLDGDIDLPEKLSFIATKSPSAHIDYGTISSFVD